MSEQVIAAPAAPEVSSEASIESNPETNVEAKEVAAEVDPKAEVKTEAKPKKETPAEKKANKKALKLKLDGREVIEEIDLDNEEELVKHLQMSKIAGKRMQEKAELEKGIKSFFEAFQKDPLAVLMDPNLNITDAQRQELAKRIINNEIEELQKTPEQKEKERLQKEYENLKKKYEEEQKAREQAEMQALQDKYAVEFDQKISDSISKGGLPKTPRTVKYMAEAMMFALENDIDIDPNDLAPLVKKQLMGDLKEVVGSLPDDEFENWIGKDRISNMRKKSIAKMKQVVDATKIKDTGEVKKDAAPKKKIDMKDFMKGLGKW